jgi:hypothetical protein
VLVRLLDEEGSSFDETVGVLSAAYQLARLLGARP